MAAVYVNPVRNFKIDLGKLAEACHGRAILMGDFNARHENWSHGRNGSGRTLQAWAAKNCWKVATSEQPTFDRGFNCSNQIY